MLPLFFVVYITDKIAFHLENSATIYYNKINSCILRKGHLLPLAKDGKKIQSVADVDFADLRLLAYAPDGASYEYYTDDGETKDYDKPEHFVHITLDADGNAKSDRATVKVEG